MTAHTAPDGDETPGMSGGEVGLSEGEREALFLRAWPWPVDVAAAVERIVRDRLAQVTAENKALRATVERVEGRDFAETFLSVWSQPYFGPGANDAVSAVQRALRAALGYDEAGDVPSDARGSDLRASTTQPRVSGSTGMCQDASEEKA